LPLKKQCNKIGCLNLCNLGERYCGQHKHLEGEQKQERHKQYDRQRRDKKSARFYKSQAWRRVRQQALIRDHGLCQDCLKLERITPADTVHHEVEISQDWSKRLDIVNLVSLCSACHNRRHGKG